MKTKLFFGCVLLAITSILLMAGAGGTRYHGFFFGDGSGLTNLPAASATNAVANLRSNGSVFGTLMTTLGVSNSATIGWTGHSNAGVGTLVANGLYVNDTGNPGVLSGASIGTNLTVVTNIATQAATVATNSLAGQLGAVYATDAELASATNAATLTSSVNATNAGNIAFKPANNAFTGSNNFAGNTTFALPPLGSGAGLTNISVVPGPFTNTVFAYGNATNIGSLYTTQLIVTASSSAGSYVMIGSANTLSNLIISTSGSNDMRFQTGGTNNFGTTNGVFTMNNDAVFERSITGNGNGITNVLERNVAVSTNTTLGGQSVDFSRGTMQLTNFPAGNVTLDAITGFTTSNLNWVTYDIQPDASAVRTLTVNASWFVSGFTNATVVAITNGQWAELTITAIIGRRTNASIVFWQ